MPNKKKQTREERLLKKRIAERKRYMLIKSNPRLLEEKREKDKQRYLKRKAEKKQLTINEMTPRQKREQRKKWRRHFRSYYLRKKQAKKDAQFATEKIQPTPTNTPDTITTNQKNSNVALNIIIKHQKNVPPYSSDTEINSNIKAESTEKQIRQIRYKHGKDIKILKNMVDNLKRENNRYRKQLGRLILKQGIISKKNLNQELQVKILCRKVSKRNKEISEKSKHAKEDIELFFEEDDNSRICPGKKEFISRNKLRKQKRYLNDTFNQSS